MACLEGLRKAMSGTDLPLIIETDCSSVTKALILSSIDRSEVGTIAKEFQAMKGNREVRVCKVEIKGSVDYVLVGDTLKTGYVMQLLYFYLLLLNI